MPRYAAPFFNFGQLIREDNQALDKTYVYEYNGIGNITKVHTCPYTTGAVSEDDYASTVEYKYTNTTHPDRLTNFNGNIIYYDSLGCPTYHNGKNYSWRLGRLTAITRGSAQQVGSLYENCSFTYDAYGRRTAKSYIYDSNPGSTSDYSYRYDTAYTYDESGRLIRELLTEKMTYSGGGSNTREFIYLYDESGIIGVQYSINGATPSVYYYRRNLQGDVIAIYDASGSRKVEYAYDAYGNCSIIYGVSHDLANRNPIRYRGYYYDRETGLYYLNARYYNPGWRRFISPAPVGTLNPSVANGLNLYSYANNNPISIAYSSSSILGGINGGMVCSFGASALPAQNILSLSFSLPPLPVWTKYTTTALDVFSSFAGVFETSIWAMTPAGKMFSDFHYAAYGINRFAMLDELTSPLGKTCKGLGIGLIAIDLGMNIYNSIQQDYSFVQGSTSFALTAAKDIGIYYASAKVAGAVGSYIAGSKLGTALGSWAGPVGMIIGAIAGFAVGYAIDKFGDAIINWIVNLFD